MPSRLIRTPSRIDLALEAPAEIMQLQLGHPPVGGIAGPLVGQPELPGPERGGPADIGAVRQAQRDYDALQFETAIGELGSLIHASSEQLRRKIKELVAEYESTPRPTDAPSQVSSATEAARPIADA